MGALSQLWAEVRPRSTSLGCKPSLCSLLTPLDCRAKCQPHVAWWVAPACAAQRHILNFQPGDALRSALTRQVFPTVLLMFTVPWGFLETSLHSLVWDAIFKVGCKGLNGISKAAHLGKFLLAPELAFASRVNIQPAEPPSKIIRQTPQPQDWFKNDIIIIVGHI